MRSLLLFVGLGLTVSCGGASPATERTAVVAVANDPGHFNPGITTAAHVHAVADSLFNGLVALDRDLKPQPDLATRWDIEENGRRYVFHLAENVR